MKIKKNIKLFLLLFSMAIISSCDKGGNPEAGGTTTKDYAGDWFISAKDQNGDVVFEHALHATYNTAANDNTMWIDDWLTRLATPAGTPSGYNLRSKIKFDLSSGVFSGQSQINLNDDGVNTVIISDGKIEKGAGLSKGGHKVDKISFKAVFSQDPAGTIISFEGHKRTGFKEDEY
jgi:Lipid-binding putative hydrolase